MALLEYNFTDEEGGGIEPNGSGYYTISYMVLPSVATVTQVDYEAYENYYATVLTGDLDVVLDDIETNFATVTGSLSTAIDIITNHTSTSAYSVYFSDVAKVVFDKKTWGSPDTDAAIVIGAKNYIGEGDTLFTDSNTQASARGPEFGPAIYGDIWFNASYSEWDNVTSGTNDFVTAMHEIAHSLGLAHTSGGSQASLKYTIMGDGSPIGHPDNDVIVGNAWNNTLSGGDGNDLLFGDGMAYQGYGKDGSGAYLHKGFTETDSQRSTTQDGVDAQHYSGNDTLVGGGGNDVLKAGAGLNQIASGGEYKQDNDYYIIGLNNKSADAAYAKVSGYVNHATIGSESTVNIYGSSGLRGETNTYLYSIENVVAEYWYPDSRVDIKKKSMMDSIKQSYLTIFGRLYRES